MLLSEFIRQSVSALEHLYPSPEARGIVLMVCEDRIGTKSYTHIVEPATEVPEEALAGLQEDIRRLAAAEPVQYVLGYTEFCGRRFSVAPGVLIPRPETEILAMELVSHALDLRRPARILDLCTGSGCIAWTAALDVPDSQVVAVDISDDALAIARSQFHQWVDFVKADVLDTESDFPHGQFDIIASNPPYIKECEKAEMRPNVLEYEPDLALFVPDEDPLLFYRAVAEWAERLLKPDGWGIVEINETLGDETEAVFREHGFPKTSQLKDFSEKVRFVTFQR